jgi:thiamine-phosphate pyrophosphorylase
MRHRIKGLYLVTDTCIQNRYSHVELARKSVPEGLNMIQLRDKKMPAGPLLEAALEIAQICREYNCLFIVNDRVDVALAAGADGVHLGQEDLPIGQARGILGPDKIIGGTASNMEEGREVEEAGADYVGFGHIYETGTKKKDYPPRGVDGLRRMTEAVRLPVTAIGGIDENNMKDVLRAGAAAVVSAPGRVRCRRPSDRRRDRPRRSGAGGSAPP